MKKGPNNPIKKVYKADGSVEVPDARFRLSNHKGKIALAFAVALAGGCWFGSQFIGKSEAESDSSQPAGTSGQEGVPPSPSTLKGNGILGTPPPTPSFNDVPPGQWHDRNDTSGFSVDSVEDQTFSSGELVDPQSAMRDLLLQLRDAGFTSEEIEAYQNKFDALKGRFDKKTYLEILESIMKRLNEMIRDDENKQKIKDYLNSRLA